MINHRSYTHNLSILILHERRFETPRMTTIDKAGSQQSQQDRNPKRQCNIAQGQPSAHLDNAQ